jgi:biopolymer transport protein ExbD
VRRRVETGAELDVIPVLSLIVHLIPMLLLSVRFSTLAQLEAGGPLVPRTAPPSPAALVEQERDVVSVRITPEGFLTGGDGAADPRIPCHGACTPETYDYPALAQAMRAAKRLHPSETRVVVVPDGEVPYEVVVRVFEAARGDGASPLFPMPMLAAPEPG